MAIGGRSLSLTMTRDGQRVFAGIQDQDKVVVISVPKRKILHVINTPKGAGPGPGHSSRVSDCQPTWQPCRRSERYPFGHLVDINELVRVQQRPAIGTERLAATEELGCQTPFLRIGRAGESEQVRAFDLRSRSGPPRVSRGRPAHCAAVLARWLLRSVSAWGAIVVTGRRGQLALVSGRSNASKKG